MKTVKLLALGLMVSNSVMAAPIIKSWSNPECATGNCEVKALRLYIDKMVDKTFAANMAAVEIETARPEQLAKYGIVQYIKGCHYTKSNKTGFVKFSTRKSLGKLVNFIHKDWEVDSGEDSDPIYWSNDAAGYDELRGFYVPRNSGYSHTNMAYTDKWGSWGGKIKNLNANKIYVSDMPSSASWSMNQSLEQIVNVSSLQFKTCVYDMSKVPTEIDDAQVEFADPIGCLEWSSNYDYNYSKRRFVEMSEVDPVCSR